MIKTPQLTKEDIKIIRADATQILQPQQKIEHDFLKDITFLRGLNWGFPRYGHPEGKILYHIREVLDNIDSIPNLRKEAYQKLRIIAFVHDTFKDRENKARPRDWLKHHAVYARDFLADYTSDKNLLDIVELHDEAYYIWRNIFLQHQPDLGELRKKRLIERIGDSLQLYYLFFKCDTQTGDKIQSPLEWFEENMEGIEIVNF